MRTRGLICLPMLGLALAATATIAHADAPERDIAKFSSGTGNLIFLGAGVGLPLIEDGKDGKNHTLRTLDALGTTVLLTDGLKLLTREKRPDGSARNSLPSGHASAAFAVATIESSLHPRQAPLWYAGATVISASRVSLHRHYVHDVVVGAALGYLTARWELSRPRGILLSPWIVPDQRHVGVQFNVRF